MPFVFGVIRYGPVRKEPVSVLPIAKAVLGTIVASITADSTSLISRRIREDFLAIFFSPFSSRYGCCHTAASMLNLLS